MSDTVKYLIIIAVLAILGVKFGPDLMGAIGVGKPSVEVVVE